jgi:type II secretory pathway pseudopilin PulG
MHRLWRDCKGITLAEVIISVVLVALIVGSLIAAVSQSSVFSRRIDMVYTASSLAQRRIDLLKRLNFDQLSSAVETDVRVDARGNYDSGGNYIRTTEVTTDHDGNPYLTKVKVSVKKVKIIMYGGIESTETLGQPVIMEMLFTDAD